MVAKMPLPRADNKLTADKLYYKLTSQIINHTTHKKCLNSHNWCLIITSNIKNEIGYTLN